MRLIMSISATQVRELRDRTGAGMMECKKALEVANGDIELAIDNMRKQGQAKADKKSSRTAAEGLVVALVSKDSHFAVMVEINSETDFVSRDASFVAFCQKVAEQALQHRTADITALLSAPYGDGHTVEEARKTLVAKIGENIVVRRVIILSADNGIAASYIHGGRIGVLVALQGGQVDLAKDIAMHIAASNPTVIHSSDYPQDLLAKEREIYAAGLQDSGKPAAMIDKIVEGKLNKFLEQVTLIGQPFVKDPDTSVGALLDKSNAKVTAFLRYQVGEGIEKESVDFAQEVMAQVRGGA